MKYIKLFEEHYPWYKDYKYNIGDFVQAKTKSWMDIPFVIELQDNEEPINKYHIRSIDDQYCYWEYENNLVPISVKEVEEYKMKQLSKKYNIE